MVSSLGPVPVFIVMGVCGCGKTSTALELQQLLGCEYIEGDILHPKANVDKMEAGKFYGKATRRKRGWQGS